MFKHLLSAYASLIYLPWLLFAIARGLFDFSFTFFFQAARLRKEKISALLWPAFLFLTAFIVLGMYFFLLQLIGNNIWGLI